MNDDNSLFGGLVYQYSREQSIQDGVLVDVTETSEAKEAGFKVPIALTRSVWDRYVEVPTEVMGQDVAGRLWDLLYMLRIAIQRSAPGTDTLFVKLHVRNDNRSGNQPMVTLKARFGPGDHDEPVLTVMEVQES